MRWRVGNSVGMQFREAGAGQFRQRLHTPSKYTEGPGQGWCDGQASKLNVLLITR